MPAGGDYKSGERQALRAEKKAVKAAKTKTNIDSFGMNKETVQPNIFGMNNIDDPYELGMLYKG